MKVKNLLISLGLLLVSGACAFVGINFSRNDIQMASAHSTTGLVLVHSGNSESLIGSSAYIIGSATSYGLLDNGRFGKDGTLLEFVIAKGTTGSKIRLKRADNGKYLDNPITGTYSESPVDHHVDTSYYFGPGSDISQYYRAAKKKSDGSTYYEVFSDDELSPNSLLSKFEVWAGKQKLNLKVNNSWASENARFAAYFFDSPSLSPTWVDMTLVTGSTKLYEVEVPNTYTQVIFGRMNPATDINNFDEGVCWGKTADLTFAGENYFLMNDDGYGNGNWHDGTDKVYLRGNYTDPEWTVNGEQLTWNKLSGQYELKEYAGLAKNNEFKVFDVTNSNDAGYAASGMTNDYSLFSSNGSNIVCNTDTTYDIYYKPFDNKLWIEEYAGAVATNFAETFLTITDGVCKDSSEGHGDTDVDQLVAVWNIKETPDGTSLEEKWSVLSAGAKGIFSEGTANVTIENAVERYVLIMGRYSNKLHEFVDGPAYSANHVINIISNHYNNNAIVVMIVTISALALVALVTFIVLKKRHN